MIAWELTRACNLSCLHCRAAAVSSAPPGAIRATMGCCLAICSMNLARKLLKRMKTVPLAPAGAAALARW